MKLLTTFLLFCAALFVVSCQKELSFENNSPAGTAAVYTFGGTGSKCAGVLLNGTYMNGVALTSLNTVTIQIYVTQEGTYSVNTTAVAGVSFSATGNFTDTGMHTITLTGSGTPNVTGVKTFTISGNGANCSFDATFAPPAPPSVFTLEGAPNACSIPAINGTYMVTVALGVSNTVIIKADVTTAGAYNIVTNTVNGISFSASGVFATTGTGIAITLNGTGTPLAAGVTTLKPATGAVNCSFDVTIAAAPVVTGTYSCKIDGVVTTFTEMAAASVVDPVNNGPGLNTDGYVDANHNQEFQIFISNNDMSVVKAGTYDGNHYIPTATSLGYNIEVNYTALNADLSTTIWSTGSNLPPLVVNNPAFTIVVTSVTATRAKGTFSGKLTNSLQGSTAFKTITEGVFDLPVQ